MFLSRTLIFLGLAATSTFAAPAQLETRDTVCLHYFIMISSPS